MPRIRAQELDQFFRDLRETVLALEQAHEQGNLSDYLRQAAIESRFGNPLARSYRFLLKAPKLPDPEGLRRKTVHALLDQTREELFKIDNWFHAEIESISVDCPEPLGPESLPDNMSDPPSPQSEALEAKQRETEHRESALLEAEQLEAEVLVVEQREADHREAEQMAERNGEPEEPEEIVRYEDAEDPSDGESNIDDAVAKSAIRYVVTQGLEEPVHLRLDQILAARSWGIGFFFNDIEDTDRVADLRARSALEHLARDLLDLSRMLPRLLRGKPGQYPPLVPPRFSRAAEQLIADIVNEHEPNASLSRLCEDYLQKTDLRVRYVGLQRRRGARVQVTLGPTQAQHQQKIETIRNPDHFVILSPWALASSIPHFGCEATAAQVPMDHDLVQRFWRCLPGQPDSLESLAYTIRGLLHNAIHGNIRDPRGPLVRVPEPVRELIRFWVKHEAFRSTLAMREWEETEGEFFRRPDGRLGTRPLLNPRMPSALKKFVEEHPLGSRVQGRVHAVGPKSAIIDLGNALFGKITREEVSWSTTQAKLKLFLEEGQEYEFVVVGTGRSAYDLVSLSRKRLQPDPWANPEIASLAQQTSVTGRIQSQTPFGLFVELLPDVVGLLHRSTVPEMIQEAVWKQYPKDAVIQVSVLSLDLTQRRISLALAPKQVAATNSHEQVG